MQRKQVGEGAGNARRGGRLARNLLLSLVATLLPFVAIEFGLRLYHAYVKARSSYEHADNPSVVFVRKPHAHQEINSLGFRDYEYAIQKPPGVYRVITLGDSVTDGYGVDFGDMYTKKLESLLREHDGRYEVISFGMSQYATVQEIALFKELGVKMRPDLVIVSYVLNDPTMDGSINDFFTRDRAGSLAVEWLLRKSRELLSVRDRFDQVKGCRHFEYYSHMHCDADKRAAISASLRELRGLSRRHGFRVLLVVFPLLDDSASFEDYRWSQIHERIVEEAADNGFAVLDLLPYFAQLPPSQLRIAPTDMLHPNGLGNQIAATAIHRKLVGLGVVGPPRAERERPKQ